MRQTLRRLSRLVRFLGAAFGVALQQQLAHRTNLAVALVTTAFGASGTIGALAAVYAHVERLAGWRFGEAVVLLGIYLVVTALLETFVWPNLQWFGDQVKNGTLDDILLTPVPSLFLASFRSCHPLALSNALIGAGIAAGGVLALGQDASLVTPANVIACLLLILAGTIVAWALRLLMACIAFWSPGLEPAMFYAGAWQLGRYPLDVYAPWVRTLLTYVIPVAYVSTLPALTLTRGADPLVLLGGVVAATVAVGLVGLVWQAGLRRYTSATS